MITFDGVRSIRYKWLAKRLLSKLKDSDGVRTLRVDGFISRALKAGRFSKARVTAPDGLVVVRCNGPHVFTYFCENLDAPLIAAGGPVYVANQPNTYWPDAPSGATPIIGGTPVDYRTDYYDNFKAGAKCSVRLLELDVGPITNNSPTGTDFWGTVYPGWNPSDGAPVVFPATPVVRTFSNEVVAIGTLGAEAGRAGQNADSAAVFYGNSTRPHVDGTDQVRYGRAWRFDLNFMRGGNIYTQSDGFVGFIKSLQNYAFASNPSGFENYPVVYDQASWMLLRFSDFSWQSVVYSDSIDNNFETGGLPLDKSLINLPFCTYQNNTWPVLRVYYNPDYSVEIADITDTIPYESALWSDVEPLLMPYMLDAGIRRTYPAYPSPLDAYWSDASSWDHSAYNTAHPGAVYGSAPVDDLWVGYPGPPNDFWKQQDCRELLSQIMMGYDDTVGTGTKFLDSTDPKLLNRWFYGHDKAFHFWCPITGNVVFSVGLDGLSMYYVAMPAIVGTGGVRPTITYSGANELYACVCDQITITGNNCVGMHIGSPFVGWHDLPMPSGPTLFAKPSGVAVSVDTEGNKLITAIFYALVNVTLDTGPATQVQRVVYKLNSAGIGSGDWKVVGTMPNDDANYSSFDLTVFGTNAEALSMSKMPFRNVMTMQNVIFDGDVPFAHKFNPWKQDFATITATPQLFSNWQSIITASYP